MKKLFFILIAAALCVGIYFYVSGKDEEKETANDSGIVEQLKTACQSAANSSSLSSLGEDGGKWYIFELEVIHHSEKEIHTYLEDELGEDFKTTLSNGDKLFVGFLPYRHSFRIYAGSPDEKNMIYPDLNYDKLDISS